MRFAYVEGRDVLHGVDLDLEPGERIAMVGPSGAGKSTLGRLLAGIHPPRTGSVTVGGVGMIELPLDELRKQVALVTQEHHVFVGTLRRQPVAGAARRPTDAELLRARWQPSTPGTGRRRCRTGSTPWSAPAALPLTPRRHSSSRWPDWSSPTRTRWCSTRRRR